MLSKPTLVNCSAVKKKLNFSVRSKMDDSMLNRSVDIWTYNVLGLIDEFLLEFLLHSSSLYWSVISIKLLKVHQTIKISANFALSIFKERVRLPSLLKLLKILKFSSFSMHHLKAAKIVVQSKRRDLHQWKLWIAFKWQQHKQQVLFSLLMNYEILHSTNKSSRTEAKNETNAVRLHETFMCKWNPLQIVCMKISCKSFNSINKFVLVWQT